MHGVLSKAVFFPAKYSIFPGFVCTLTTHCGVLQRIKVREKKSQYSAIIIPDVKIANTTVYISIRCFDGKRQFSRNYSVDRVSSK